ncbi:hypothetical protein BH10BAC3_BH10BAC3_12150 [soil metagenome]
MDNKSLYLAVNTKQVDFRTDLQWYVTQIILDSRLLSNKKFCSKITPAAHRTDPGKKTKLFGINTKPAPTRHTEPVEVPSFIPHPVWPFIRRTLETALNFLLCKSSSASLPGGIYQYVHLASHYCHKAILFPALHLAGMQAGYLIASVLCQVLPHFACHVAIGFGAFHPAAASYQHCPFRALLTGIKKRSRQKPGSSQTQPEVTTNPDRNFYKSVRLFCLRNLQYLLIRSTSHFIPRLTK